jgi:Kef-type K+ transport system membrane component KefB
VDLERELISLLVIAGISAAVPFILGLTRIRVAGAVLLIALGIVFGPQVLGWIEIDASINLLADLGLGMLFFLAGLELEGRVLRGTSGKLAVSGWLVSLALAVLLVGILFATGLVKDYLAVAIALTSTALGTLLPQLRDSGTLKTPLGRFFMGAGAVGELGPLIAISVLLGTQNSFVALSTLIAFGLIALILAAIPRRFMNDKIAKLIEAGHHSSAQTGVRLAMVLLIGLLATAGLFGFDVVLGAFIAGIIVRRYVPTSDESAVELRIEAIAFGFFIPLFFVVSGAKLDVQSIIDNPLPMIVFFLLLAVVRGLPQFFLYRSAIPDPWQRGRFAALVATGLPIIVAVTTIQVELGLMTEASAAAMVGAGALSVLVFPAFAQWCDRKSPADRVGNSVSDG